MSHVILNSRPLAAEELRISAADRGFRYGDGVFETLRVQGGVPYQFDWHMGRLARGLAAIRIHNDITGLQRQCADLLAMNKIKNGLLRIQVTRGVGGHGYLPDAKSEPTVLIETLSLPPVQAGAVSIYTSRWRKPSAQVLPSGVKLCQGMNSTLARMEAADRGCFEALQLGEEGNIAEVSSGNIFWLKDGTLYTPSLDCHIVEGATRAAILRLSPYKVKEVCAKTDVLKEAEAVVITNVVWKALAVESLMPEEWRWNSQELASELCVLLEADIEGYRQQHGISWAA